MPCWGGKDGGLTLVTSYLLISNRIVSLPVSTRCCNSRCLVSNSNIRKFVCFCFCLGANNWCLPPLVLRLLFLYLSLLPFCLLLSSARFCYSCLFFLIENTVESCLIPWTQTSSLVNVLQQAVYTVFPVQLTVSPVYIALCI